MIDRRLFIAGGLALGAAPGRGAAPSGKRRAIEGIALPPGFNGLIGYARDGRLRHLRVAGLADIEARVPVTAATQFRWGSATKWLVSVAALRLVEQGRLALDAPITAYLPDFRRDTGDRVQLQHLLANTSGIPDLLTRELAREPGLRSSTASPAAIVARFGGGDLAFRPGAGWDYAALNWVIVAALLARVTGEPLPRTVERLVFRPLAMTGAGFDQADQPPLPHLAAAYADAHDPAVLPARKPAAVPAFAAASGNVAATAADAVRAAHGVFHGRLLSPASRAELTRIRWPAEDYALGGRVRVVNGVRWAWEAGKVGGYRALVAHRLDRSETVVAFNTTDLAQPVLATWVEAIARA